MSHAWVYCHNWSLYITDETQIWQYSYVYGWELLKLYFDYNHRYKSWLKRNQSLESQPQIVCPGPNKTVHVLVMHRGVKTEALLVLWKHRFIQFHYSFVSKKSHFVSHCGAADGSTSEPRALLLWEKVSQWCESKHCSRCAAKRSTTLHWVHPRPKKKMRRRNKRVIWICKSLFVAVCSCGLKCIFGYEITTISL